MTRKSNKPSTQLDKDLSELTAVLQRTQADFENYRRRAEEQRAELMDYAKKEVIRNFLPILDSCERLLKHVSTVSEVDPWKQGAEAIGKQIEKTLKDMGVERIKTVGKPFDPHLHEAVSVDGNSGDEIVSEELQAGYSLGDDVIRHAVVKVKRQRPSKLPGKVEEKSK